LSLERRTTKQKEAIKAVLAGEGGPLLPDEIHVLAQKAVPSLGIATVYRSLKSLQDEGLVCCVEIPGHAPRYERADKGHHHHFHCQKCHAVFDLEKCVEGLKKLVPSGFQVTSHEITLHGLCKTCA
jgi:Fur family transcriptional regulator, ferric uptake regulator